MLRILIIAIGLITMAVPLPVHAASKADTMDIDKHPAAQRIRMVRSTFKRLRKKMAAKAYDDDKKRDSMFRDIRSQNSRIAFILKKDPDFPAGPWKKELTTMKSTLDRVQAAAEKARKEKAAKQRAELKKLTDYRLMMDRGYSGFLHNASKGTFDAVGYERMMAFLGHVDRVGKWANKLAAKCKNDGYEQLPASKFRKEKHRPKVACKNARNYKALVLRYIDANVAFDVADVTKKNKEAIQGLEKDGLIAFRAFNRLGSPKKTTDAFTRKYARAYKTYGGQVNPAAFAKLKAQSKTFATALKAAGKVSRLPKQARYNAPLFTAAAKKKYAKNKLHKVKSIHLDWKVKRNALGHPVSREKWGFAVVQVKGDDFCRIIQGEAFSRRKGGTWTQPVWETHNNAFYVGACR